mgnify:FL=1
MESITVARPYAQAAFEEAQADQSYPTWTELLQLLCVAVQDPVLEELLDNPQISEEQLADILIGLAGDKADQKGRNFIRLLAENRRLGIVPEIASHFAELRNEAEGAVEAELVTAFPVTDDQKEKIIAALKVRLDRDIRLECSIDKTLLGGAVIRAGDLVIDGSVQGKLARLATTLSH